MSKTEGTMGGATAEGVEVDIDNSLEGFGEGLDIDDGQGDSSSSDKSDDSEKATEDKTEETKSEDNSSDEKEKGEEGADDTADDAKEAKDDSDGDGAESKDDTDKGEDADGDGSDAATTDEIELKLPDDIKSDEPETWETVGSELELEVKGKDFSDFKEAFDSKLENIKTEAINEVKKDPLSVLDIKDDTAKAIIKHTLDGGSVADFIEPTAQIDQFLALNNEDLLKADYIAREFSEAEAEERVARDADSGDLDFKARELRAELKQSRQDAINEIIYQRQEEIKKAKQAEEDSKVESDKVFNDKLTGRQEYRGAKLTQEHLDYVRGLYNSGQVHDMFKNPDMVIDFLLENTFGKQISSRQQEASRAEGKDEVKKELHNIKPEIEAGGSRTQTPKADDKQGFGEWDDVKDEEGVEVEYLRP